MVDEKNGNNSGKGDGCKGRYRGGGSGRGRNGGRGGGRGRHQDREKSNRKVTNNGQREGEIGNTPENDGLMKNEEAMRLRKEKFEQTESKQDNVKNYGLISRGDDMRLKKDEKARVSLFEATIKDIEKYDLGNTEALKDGILISFRKLRECVVSLENDGGKDFESFKKIYISSLNFSIKCGDVKSYISARGYIDSRREVWGCTEDEKKWMDLTYAMHLVNFEKDYEKAFEVVNKLIGYKPVRIVNRSTPCDDPVACVYNMLVCDLQQAPDMWLQHRQHNTALVARCGGAKIVEKHRAMFVAQQQKAYRGKVANAEK